MIMIVKNESKIIQRCLTTAKPILAGICITDTGSTDNTVETIKKWAEKEKMACEVPVKAFRDFGFSRTASFLHGRRYFPKASYYLLLDADMNLIIKSNFKMEELITDGYRVYQQNGTNRYQNVRLIKADRTWKCVGVTHEYWECENGKLGDLHTLEIDDKDDGGCKSDKYARDKGLLLHGLSDKRTPNHLKIRYRFYLAQTYFCLQEFKAAISEYEKRFKAGEWAEEQWFSLFKIGEAYMRMADCCQGPIKETKEAEGVAGYLRAWNFRTTRAETLQKLAEYYRKKSMNRLAFHFANLAQSIGYPHKDSLFIDTPTYDYLLDFEVSINAFYVPDKKNVGLQAHRRLKAIMHKLPPDIQSTIEHNEQFYLC